METTALARRLLQHHRAAQLPDHVLDRVQADAASGHFGDLVAQAETGQEQEGQQLLFAQAGGGLLRERPRSTMLRRTRSRSTPAPSSASSNTSRPA